MRIEPNFVKDLQISVKNEKSLFTLFNFTNSQLGESKLRELAQHPLSNIDDILGRQRVLKNLFKRREFYGKFPFEQLDKLNDYLDKRWIIAPSSKNFPVLWHYAKYSFNHSSELNLIQSHSLEFLGLLGRLRNTHTLIIEKQYNLHEFEVTLFQDSFDLFDQLTKDMNSSSSSLKGWELVKIDFLLRNTLRLKARKFLEILGELEGLLSLAMFSHFPGYTFPKVELRDCQEEFCLTDFFHPLVEKPIKNSFALGKRQNIFVITGPNASGKSILLKSIAMIVYLAHLGCAVPASKATIPFVEHLFVSFVKRDDLWQGESLFTNQLNQWEELANKAKNDERNLAIFDELFSGTNFQDGYDCSIYVLKRIKNCEKVRCIVSTHQQEVAFEFEGDEKVCLNKLEGEWHGDTFQPDFNLVDGVSEEKLGLKLLQRRKIFDEL